MDIDIKGNLYKTGRLSAMRQLHVLRRLAPALEQLLAIDGASLKTAAGDGAAAAAALLDGEAGRDLLRAITRALSSLADEDVEYIIHSCLDVASMRQEGGSWAPVRNQGHLMFPLDLPTMIQLAGLTLKEALTPFLAGLPSISTGGGRT